jgi:hypothetical protein
MPAMRGGFEDAAASQSGVGGRRDHQTQNKLFRRDLCHRTPKHASPKWKFPIYSQQLKRIFFLKNKWGCPKNTITSSAKGCQRVAQERSDIGQPTLRMPPLLSLLFLDYRAFERKKYPVHKGDVAGLSDTTALPKRRGRRFHPARRFAQKLKHRFQTCATLQPVRLQGGPGNPRFSPSRNLAPPKRTDARKSKS